MNNKSRGAPRRHDLVVYGASGFVGRQLVRYLAGAAPALRWAVAGRSAVRLDAVRAQVAPAEPELLVAAADDAAALDRVAQSARVVLSAAGPFARHGSELVAACVRNGTHYADISGETPWVRALIERHHAQARRSGTRIVPGCGFFSVPSDIGTWRVAHALLARHKERCASVKASYTIRFGLNGGTVESLLNVFDSGQRKAAAEPFLLNPKGTAPPDAAAHADPVAPHRDADFDAWLGPFVLGPVNTRVVRRSAALLLGDSTFTPDFRYQEYLNFGRGAKGALAAAGTSIGLAAGESSLAFEPVRKALRAIAPGRGEGPRARTIEAGHFRCDLIATGERGAVLRGSVSGPGDPSNRGTATIAGEAALALALDTDALPGGARFGGVLTPATALGDALAVRLRRAGITIEP
jgi:short subunit dehydrogenase-like uncharacterized protein